MKPMSKFALFLAVAGILTVLFALFPARDAKIPPSTKSLPHTQERDGRTQPPTPPRGANRGDVMMAASRVGALPSAATPGLSQVMAPAIRGVTNYGWVRLPHGTPVDLVRENGTRLWVRWDGTVMDVPRATVSTGALVIRASKPLAERS